MPKKSRKLTKKEITNISLRANEYYQKFPKDVTSSIERAVLKERHISEKSHRRIISKILALNGDLIKTFSDKYCELLVSSYKGRHAERMSNLNIGWITYVSHFIEPGKPQHIWLSHRLKKSKKNFDSSDISATIHAFANVFFNHISSYIVQLQTHYSLPKDISKKDQKSSLLAFGGGCLRLMYAKAKNNEDKLTCSYINHLRLSKEQREEMIDKNVIKSTNLKSLHSIPVPALVPYLEYLNESIQAMCNKRSLSQLKSSFIKVSNKWICIISV